MQQLQDAVALHNEGELDQAEAIYRQILAVDTSNFYALNFLGCLCRLRGLYSEGIELLKKAVEIDPLNVNCLVSLGNILGDAGDDNAAIPYFLRAIEIKGDCAVARESLGDSLCKEGRYEESEKMLKSALCINPRSHLSWFNLGVAFFRQEKFSEAIASYRKANELNPDYAEAYINLGIVLEKKGEVEESISSYRKAIKVKPDFADAYINLALLLQEMGDAEAAADAFAEHYRLKPIAQSISFASAVAPKSLNTESVVKVPDGAEFIPSYVSDAIPFGMHMMYLHIPKAGGVRFSNPIFSCIQQMLLKGGWEKYRDLAASAFGRERVSVMASHRIDSAPMRDGIMAAFSSYDLPSLDFSFLTPHGVSSSELSLAVRDRLMQPIRLAAWRDPWKRLRSALDYFYRTSGDLDSSREDHQKDPFSIMQSIGDVLVTFCLRYRLMSGVMSRSTI